MDSSARQPHHQRARLWVGCAYTVLIIEREWLDVRGMSVECEIAGRRFARVDEAVKAYRVAAACCFYDVPARMTLRARSHRYGIKRAYALRRHGVEVSPDEIGAWMAQYYERELRYADDPSPAGAWLPEVTPAE
jgi:hypothetical protein